MTLLDAVKLAYRKHHLGDESIGWDELSECLLDALCNEMGDDGYQEWLASQHAVQADAYCDCAFRRELEHAEKSKCLQCHKPIRTA